MIQKRRTVPRAALQAWHQLNFLILKILLSVTAGEFLNLMLDWTG